MSGPDGPALPTLPPEPGDDATDADADIEATDAADDTDDEAFGTGSAGASASPAPEAPAPGDGDATTEDLQPGAASAGPGPSTADMGAGAPPVPDEPPEGEAAGAPCPACGEPLVGSAKFCEACGAPVAGADVSTSPAAAAAADGGAPPCARCGAEIGDDGYCTSCGHRALEPVTVDDQGAMAYATHRGRRHDRNEDAAAVATTSEGWPVLVVSDGVSASPNPHRASAAAVEAAATRLAGRPFESNDDLVAAVELAHKAACDVPIAGDPHWVDDGTHPACTIVVAVVTPTDAHMANVGDARGYVLAAGAPGASDPSDPSGAPDAGEGEPTWQALQLTTDDSVAAEAVAEGVDPDVALTLEGGHAITGWLGADATSLEVHLVHHPVGPDDLVLVCSDGLWNYATTDAALGGLASAHLPPPGTPPGPLGPPCEELVDWANGRGGADNITVTIAVVPAEDGGAEREVPE